MMALSTKQRAFIEAFLGAARFNATEAARLAQYAGDDHTLAQVGYENLRKPEIVAEINARIEAIMPRGEIVQRLAARARATIADVLALPAIEPTPDGQQAPSPAHWQLDLVKAQQTSGIDQIKRIKQTKYGIEVELYDPLPALEDLAKLQKLFGDDGGILKYIDLSKLSQEQLQRLRDGDDILAILLDKPQTESSS